MNAAPPPWTLRGRAMMALYRPVSRPVAKDGDWRGGVQALMLVRYRHTPVGPYDELLWVDGLYRTRAGVFPRVTRITVSSEASAQAGHRYWGLPKTTSEFLFGQSGSAQQGRVTRGGRLLAHLAWQPGGFPLPAATRLLPSRFTTLVQPREDGALIRTHLRAGGLIRQARLTCAELDGPGYPDLSRARPVLCLDIPRFSMTFPVPDIC